MELVVLKDGKVFARATDEAESGEYTLDVVESLPEYPEEAAPGTFYRLERVNGVYEWVEVARQLSDNEALDIILGGAQA